MLLPGVLLLCFNWDMEDAELIAKLQEKVREAEDLLRRRKEALAALKGKGSASGSGKVRGFRGSSIPAIAYAALKGKLPLSLEELTAAVKKTKSAVDSRIVSIALSKYVRNGQHFIIHEDGKYAAK